MSLSLKGCENIATQQTCQTNPTKAGEIATTQAIEGELGFIKGGSKPKVGLDLKAKSPSPVVVTFTCGGPTGEAWTVEGSAIGQITPANRMTTVDKLLFKANGAKQVPEHFEGGVKDTLLATITQGVSQKSEQAGLTLRGDRSTIPVTNGEKLEIKAKV